MTVEPGQYTINLNCGESDENSTNPNSGRVCDWHESIGPPNIVFDYSSNRVPFNGMANLPMTLIE